MSEEKDFIDALDAEKFRVEYSFGDDPDNKERTAVKIDTGKFTGVVFAFNTIGTYKINEEDPESDVALKFDYDVIDQPDGIDVTLEENDEQFKMTVGNIAVDIFLDYLEKKIEQEKNKSNV